MNLAFEKKLILLFAAILTGIVAAGISTYKNNQSITQTDYWVQHTRQVLFETGQLFSLTQDLVLSSRGYVITGDTTYLQPYIKANENIGAHLNNLRNLVKDNAPQQLKLDTLKKLINQRIENSNQFIHARKTKGFAAAQQLINTGKGNTNFNEIRKTVNAIISRENQLLKTREDANIKSQASFNRSFYFFLSAILLLVIVVLFTVRHNLQIRKQAEEKLFIKNEWYNQTLISMGDGVITTDANGIITLINKAACELSGWSSEEAVGIHVDRIFEITSERTGLKVVNPVTEAMRVNKIMWLANHTILKRKDNSTLFIDDSGAPIHNQQKEIIGGVLIFRDVTEKKKAEDQLKRTTDNLNEAQAIAHVGNWEVDLNTGALIWSDELYRIYGFNKNETIPTVELFLSHVYPDDLAFVNEKADAVLKNFKTESFEFRIIRADGTIRWLHTQNKVLLDATGKPLRLYGINRDITESKIAEIKLKEYQHFFNHSNDLCVIANFQGYFETVNPTLEKTLGYTQHELTTMPFIDFVHPDDLQAVLSQYAQQKTESARMVNFICRFRKKEGTYVWIEWNSIPNAATGKVYAVGRDITERKKAEELLKEKSKELAHRNHEIIDSINYARRIQKAIIHKPFKSLNGFNGMFNLLMPKDILSGDFLWHYDIGNKHLIAAVDCTGHGVPGALMSLIAHQFLNLIVIEEKCYEPAEILKRLDIKLMESLNQQSLDQVRDGMDIAFCCIDATQKVIIFSGALRPLYYYNGSELIELKGNRHTIGGDSNSADTKQFAQEKITYKEGDCIYLTSDGYHSQFNSFTGKKMMKKRLSNILQSVAGKEIDEQELILKRYFNEWKGDDEQVDDVLVTGVKF